MAPDWKLRDWFKGGHIRAHTDARIHAYACTRARERTARHGTGARMELRVRKHARARREIAPYSYGLYTYDSYSYGLYSYRRDS